MFLLEKSGNIHLSGAGSTAARKVCFENLKLNKDISWKSNMENVIKYDVYLDILLMVPIFIIGLFSMENLEIPKSLRLL